MWVTVHGDLSHTHFFFFCKQLQSDAQFGDEIMRNLSAIEVAIDLFDIKRSSAAAILVTNVHKLPLSINFNDMKWSHALTYALFDDLLPPKKDLFS